MTAREKTDQLKQEKEIADLRAQIKTLVKTIEFLNSELADARMRRNLGPRRLPPVEPIPLPQYPMPTFPSYPWPAPPTITPTWCQTAAAINTL
jgi:hypothetical protein